MITVFPIRKVQQLRRAAVRACSVSREGPEGWSKSEVDPMNLLAVFSALRIKRGFILRAYLFREGGNGNGVVWALPEDVGFPEPEACLEAIQNQTELPPPDGFPAYLPGPPVPPQAQANIMDAIEGDATPWSYLSASIFAREAGEFGAMWHGCEWSTHAILGADPWTPQRAKRRERTHDEPTGSMADWKWLLAKPSEWRPSVEQSDDTTTVRFFTYTLSSETGF